MTDYVKMMTLFVDKLLNNEKFSKEERKIFIEKIIKMKVYNFLRKYKLSFSSLELYMKIYNLNEIPKCEFCGKDCKFISLSKGFAKNCRSKDCVRKLFLKNNSELKRENRIEYDNFVKDNLDFYKNVQFPFIDIYDNKEVRSQSQFSLKSASSLEIFNENKKCIFCKRDYIFNKFKYNKCFCKSCYKGHNYKFLDLYKDYSEINFKIFKLNLKNKRFSNEELLGLSKKYNNEQLYLLITGNAIIFNDYFLKRKYSNDNFRFLYNNIIENDMISTCKCCGKKYVKYDKIVKNDGSLEKIKIGAEFSCGSKECYWKCVSLYECSEEKRLKQSRCLKEKIRKGEFTPCVTNSWAQSKKFELDEICFRSSWEFLFYLIFKKYKIKLEYETLRIPYFDSELNKERTYIPDFYDAEGKIIYEIKPSNLENNLRNTSKIESARKYAKENGMKFKIVNEKFFKQNYNSKLLNFIPNDLKETCSKLWRQFE